jgi:SAM-dependent methyltransferase
MGYGYYFREHIFSKINLKKKKILDLGGGNGIAGVYAALSEESAAITIVDPLEDGSNSRMMEQYESLQEISKVKNVTFFQGFLEELAEEEKFDVILMHNSINHIAEDHVASLHLSQNAKKVYLDKLGYILSRLKSGGKFIIADCSNKNFWGFLHFPNPVAPSIEWHLHQPPEVWREIIEELGLKHQSTAWTARRELGSIGKIILANRLTSYFLDSHFVSKYSK